MLIAEDVLLLTTDDESGKPTIGSPGRELVLAGALLVELALLGRVDVADKGERVRAGRVVVRDPSMTGQVELDRALAICQEREGKSPASILDKIAKKLRERLLDQLADRGVIRAEHGKVLGIFPTTRWPEVEGGHERKIHDLLVSVLVQGTTPDQRTAAIVALLSSVDAAHKVVAQGGAEIDKRAVRKRAKEIGRGDWAAGAVTKAVEAVQAAVTAAVMTSVVASTAGSGG